MQNVKKKKPPKADKKTAAINLRVEPEIKVRLLKLAAAYEISPAEFIRRLIERGI